MSEKNLKARIVHKHDTQANWEKATGFIPMKGELIVYDIDSNYSYERFKIGDGATNVNALPFFAAGALTSEGLEQVKGVKVDNATSADSANKTVGTFTVNGVAFDGSSNKSVTITVPDELADLAADSTHRVVTDAQISAWNAKSNFSGAYADLSGKPTLGSLAAKSTVEKSDLSSGVQASLNKADSALQSFTETDPTVPAWAKASSKPSYTASEVGLGNVDNTSDANKPVSTAQQAAIDGALSSAKSYTDGKIDALVGEGASTTLDTIGEISKAIEAHQDVTDALNSAIGTKANASDLTAHTGNTSNPHGVTWDILPDKPFGEAPITVSEVMNVTWDGNIEGLDTIEVGGNTYYRISDSAPPFDTMKQVGSYVCTIRSNGQTYPFSFSGGIVLNTFEFGVRISADGNFMVFVYTATGNSPAGIYVPYDSGNYVSSITTSEPVEITKMGVKTIDPKYLPEMEAEQKQADFDQTDDTQPDYIKNKNIFKDHIILVDQANSYEYVLYIENGNLITCRKYDRIEVTSMPETTQYTYGSAFDPTGMVVEIIDQDGVAFVLDNDKLNIDMHEDGIVDITYKYGGIIYATQIAVTVGPFDPEVALIDFVYTTNDDGTYTITDWKGTTGGVAGTQLIVPNNKLVKI